MTEPTTPQAEAVRDLLARAADDEGQPLHTDVGGLVVRARAARRRRRRAAAVGTVLLAGTAVVGVTTLPTVLGGGAPPDPSRPDPAPSTRESASVVLPHAEVVRRCRPQLAKYGALPMYPRHPERSRWVVGNADLDYRVGDVVSLVAPGGLANPLLCRIPAQDATSRPVPFDAFVPTADDPAAVAARCTEAIDGSDVLFDPETESLSRRDTVPDLRGGDPVTSAGTGPVVVALLADGDQDYLCVLGPVTWDVGVNEVGPSWSRPRDTVSLRTIGTGSGAKSIVDDARTYVVGAGRTSRRATRIEVTMPDGSTATTPVRDGVWSLAADVPGFGGIVPLPTRVLARDGSVLWSGDASAT